MNEKKISDMTDEELAFLLSTTPPGPLAEQLKVDLQLRMENDRLNLRMLLWLPRRAWWPQRLGSPGPHGRWCFLPRSSWRAPRSRWSLGACADGSTW